MRFLAGLSFLLLIVTSASVLAIEGKVCGTNGSVEDRIKDCSEQYGIGKNVWTLVTRNGDDKKVWLDPTSTLIWTEPNNKRTKIEDADALCKDSKLFTSNKGNLDLNFRLPTCGEFVYSKGEGLFDVIPNLSYHLFKFPIQVLQWCKQTSRDDLSYFNLGSFADNVRNEGATTNAKVACVADYKGH
jgi:hypothetical protein